MNWWRRLRNRGRLEAELDAELRDHVERLAQDHVRAGMSEEEARRRARLEFGGVDQVKEDCRDARGTRWVEDCARDLRYGLRLLANDRWLTLSAVLALGLGIAANTVVFTIVNAMVLRGLPVDDPDRIVTFHNENQVVSSVSYRDVEDWRAAAKTLVGVAAYNNAPMIVGDEAQSPEVFSGGYISAATFRLLGERPMLGRDFQPEDDRPGAPAVVILGHSVWTARYGADPRTIGRIIRVNDVPAVVVGVMPEGFRFPLIHEVWQPLALLPGLDTERREARTLRAFGRLADGITLAEAQAELTTIAARLSRDHAATNKDIRPTVEPFTGTADHPIFLALFGAVGFVLLIACANVAGLLLARSARRSREIVVRVALGASRWRIVRQLLLEGVLLGLLGGAVGLGLAAAGVRLFASAVAGINFAYWYYENWTMDGRVFAFTAAVSLGAVLVFGLVPALLLSKTSVNDALKEAGRTGTGGAARRRWTNALLAAEFAFTLALLAGAGLMLRSFVAIYRADAIVDTSRLLTAAMRLPNEKYPTPERRTAFYQQLEERLGSIRTIASAAVASSVPFIGGPRWQLDIDGRVAGAGEKPRMVSYVSIGSRYFEALGVSLVRGRAFTDVDGTPGHESVIVNQRFVALHFPNEDPIGRRIRVTNPGARGPALPWVTIVGVSPTVRQQFLSELDPVVYVPYRLNPGSTAMLMVRAEADPAALASLIRAEVRALDPDLPLYRLMPLETLMAQSRWAHRVFGMMFAIFAAIALILSAVGLYAVTAYSVAQRTQEIGLRMALGAPSGRVVWLFVARAVTPLGLGLAIGLAGAFGVGRLMRSMLVQTSPTDPFTLVSIAMVLVVVSMAACLWPARRATRLDPVAALRYE